VRDERFAGFAQVSEGAILFGAIGPSIMSLLDGLLALVIDGSRDVLGPEIIRPVACAAIAIIIPIDMETPGSLNMNGIPSPRESDGRYAAARLGFFGSRMGFHLLPASELNPCEVRYCADLV
jgi:hypothetical protein